MSRNKPERVQTNTGTKSRTRPEFQEECDINKVLGNYRQNGFSNHVNLKNPVYDDFSNAGDYLAACNAVAAAKATFASMPARVRARVDNDPAKFIEYAENPDNMEEMIQLGLAKPRPETTEETTETPVAGTPDGQVAGD